MHISPADEQTLHDSDIKVVHNPIIGLSRQNESIVTRLQHRGSPLLFDILYSALGTRIRSELATFLGADADADGALIVDQHQRTTIPGLYAAGDVVRGLSQINIAAAQAAIAATSINSELPHLRF
jgi:thioredoxin reductase (NADPH)